MTSPHDQGEPVVAAATSTLEAQLLVYARDLQMIAARERQRASELELANQRLQRLDQLKSDFVSFISHEMKTPLTAIGMVHMLDVDSLRGDNREIAGLLKSGYDRLNRFVDRVVGYFVSLASSDDWSEESCDVLVVVANVMHACDANEFVTIESTDQPAKVQGASLALQQVLEILLDNVRKYATDEPRATITIRRLDSTVELCVQDEGRGFPPEMAAEILRPLSPADIMQHSEGSALSLALAAQIVERCGGTLVARSNGVGKGAAFVITLPAATR